MMETICDMETINDWDLFGGRLLAASSVYHATGSELQDVMQESPIDQLPVIDSPYSQSPSEEFLHDSFWLTPSADTSSLQSSPFKTELEKTEWDLGYQVANNALLDEETGNDISEFSVAISSSFGIDLLDKKFQASEVTKTGNWSDFGEQLLVECTEDAFDGVVNKFTFEIENVVESDAANVVCESDFSRDSDLEMLNVADDLLKDPESVCQILSALGKSYIEGDTKFDSHIHSSHLLRPVSPDEVDSILSDSLIEEEKSQDGGAVHLEYAGDEILSEPYKQDAVKHKIRSSSGGMSYTTRVKDQEARKQKKKEQNKTAALRYRSKKRQEKGVVMTEVEELEQKNEELKAKADDLSREINYLRGLIDEVRKHSSR